MTEHTAGPWEIEHTTLSIVRLIITPEEVGAWQIGPADAHVVAYVPSDYKAEEQEANARLIAAAPELLAALEELRQHAMWGGDKWSTVTLDEFDAIFERAGAAIAKARSQQEVNN